MAETLPSPFGRHPRWSRCPFRKLRGTFQILEEKARCDQRRDYMLQHLEQPGTTTIISRVKLNFRRRPLSSYHTFQQPKSHSAADIMTNTRWVLSLSTINRLWPDDLIVRLTRTATVGCHMSRAKQLDSESVRESNSSTSTALRAETPSPMARSKNRKFSNTFSSDRPEWLYLYTTHLTV